MKFILLKIITILSIILPTIKTPLSIGTVLLTQTVISTIFINKIILNSWFPIITFIIIIGGIIILFIYIRRIASNEKFKINLNLTFILIIFIIATEDLIIENQINETEEIIYFKNQEKISIIKLYNTKSICLTIYIVLILLLTMISISKIVLFHKGPLRIKTYE